VASHIIAQLERNQLLGERGLQDGITAQPTIGVATTQQWGQNSHNQQRDQQRKEQSAKVHKAPGTQG